MVWRSTFARLKFKPEEGLEIVAKGKITTYPGKSTYQIVIDELEPAGVGALMALLEQRKKQLAAEGLFDEARKRPLPFLPRLIGVVTSPTGAVIRDILHRLEDRFPSHVLVWPVRVQGETCASEVAAAIHGFNATTAPRRTQPARSHHRRPRRWQPRGPLGLQRGDRRACRGRERHSAHLGGGARDRLDPHRPRRRSPRADADRGGGARRTGALRASHHGAERSACAAQARCAARWKLGVSRFAASARGLPRRADILGLPRQRLDTASHKLLSALRANAVAHRSGLDKAGPRLRPHLVARAVSKGREQIIRLDRARARALHVTVDRARRRLDAQAKLLSTLGYHNVLARGFTLVRAADGTMLRKASEVKPGAALDIEFADGHVEAHADPRGVKGKGEAEAKEPRRRSDEKQGSLL